ncbi:peroxidasin homolog [Anguilla anguilla]|uniref:peroxidasin homolog n=1 Tax=Anguilla anguilla TaxID=7936 RepID=UPI0015AD6094|nr:peroxidasin homolog [Anguilla anguilla]
MQDLNIRVSFYTQLWFLWSVHSFVISDSCDAKINMVRDVWQVGMGHNFTLICEFVCIPPSDTLHWYRGASSVLNQTTNQTNFTFPLHVERAGENHSGEYYCETHPPVVSSNTVFIRVVDLSLNVSSTSAEVFEGQTVEVNCTAVSPLNATLFWGRGGCDDRQKVNGSGTLRLSPATAQHRGDYYCCSSIPTLTPLHRFKKVQVTVLRPQGILQCQVLWYLMCKTGIFLIFSAAVFILACRGQS